MRHGVEDTTKGRIVGRRVPAGHELDGQVLHEDVYLPPALANPGNVVYGPPLEELSDFFHTSVGGGRMSETGVGSKLSALSEAPFPEVLPELFIRSFCPPGGVCCDPFMGSGTTGAVSIRYGRRFIGCDLRPSMVDVSRRRLSEETPFFPEMADA
jgi:hypothetical protein